MSIVESYKGEYLGYPFHVIGLEAGHRCGYVGLPRNHSFYGMDYTTIEEETGYGLGVHGGLTYSDRSSPLETDGDYWWIGFDCAHAGDAKDDTLLSGRYKDLHKEYIHLGLYDPLDQKLWTQEMVKDECRDLIEAMS